MRAIPGGRSSAPSRPIEAGAARAGANASAMATVATRPRAAARTPIRWDRVGRLALLAVLGVIVLLYIAPTRHYLEQRETAQAHRLELERLERERARLRARLDALRRPDSLEREARKLGMVRQGERAFVIQNVPPS